MVPVEVEGGLVVEVEEELQEGEEDLEAEVEAVVDLGGEEVEEAAVSRLASRPAVVHGEALVVGSGVAVNSTFSFWRSGAYMRLGVLYAWIQLWTNQGDILLSDRCTAGPCRNRRKIAG